MEIKKIIACSTMQDEISAVNQGGVEVEFLDYGLHRYPDSLKENLQKAIDKTPEAYDHILLGYGLCSQGTIGLHSRAKVLVIPRVHDCISLFLGSRERYQEEFEREPGTIYVSKGWIDYGSYPLSEYAEYKEKMGDTKARWVMEELYKNYKRLVFIDTHVAGKDIEYYREKAAKAADFIGVRYEEISGSLLYLTKLLGSLWEKKDFVVVEPGRMAIRSNFC